MTASARALQYTVDQQGLINTRGAYSEITEQEWAQATDFSSPRYRPYDAVFRALRDHRIVKMPCPTKRQAKGIRATLRKRARDADMTIEDKLVLLSDSPEQWAVFARSVPV